MKRRINTYRSFFLTLICVCIALSRLQAQSIEILESRHGFQDIKLDSNISGYSDLIYRKSIKNQKSEEPILLYIPKKESYQKIGDVPILDLEVRTFRGKIVVIKIIAQKDPGIMQALKSLYGEPDFSVRSNAWEWQSENIILSLKSASKKKIEILYRSRKLNQYIRDLKEEGIKDISSDF
jgi:hypothetical protein